mgnify:CR=1 FL=1
MSLVRKQLDNHVRNKSERDTERNRKRDVVRRPEFYTQIMLVSNNFLEQGCVHDWISHRGYRVQVKGSGRIGNWQLDFVRNNSSLTY